MDTGRVIDLSDNVAIENARKKLARKRYNEIKRYIPFLKFITAADPVQNNKYVTLLKWLDTKKELNEKVAATCETAIRRRFKFLKSSLIYPPNITAIFEVEEEPIVLLSDDDDDDKNQSKTSTTSKNISSTSSNKQTTTNTTRNTSNIILVKKKVSTYINPKKVDIKQLPAASTSSSTIKCIKNDGVKSVIAAKVLEKKNIASVSQNVSKDGRNKFSISLSENKLKEIPTKKSEVLEDNDEAINQKLFNKIDDLAANTASPLATTGLIVKSVEKNNLIHLKRVPVVKPTNVIVQKASNSLSNTETKKKIEKDKALDSNTGIEQNTDLKESLQKQKKNEEQKTEKLNVSNERIVSSYPTPNITLTDRVESHKTLESELFQKRNLPNKDATPTSKSANENVTVLLVISDEEEINNAPPKVVETNIKTKINPILEPQSSLKDTTCCIPLPSTNVVEKTPATNLLDKSNKDESFSPRKFEDLSNMGISELNDIYLKLCERTGIQLEELLRDLLNKSSINKDHNKPVTIQDTKISSSNLDMDTDKNCLVSNTMNRDQFQQVQLYQENPYVLQQNLNHQQHQFQQKQFQQNQSSNQMYNNQSMSNQHQNFLIPSLNLNDPRIVQKLKQIKDSPIHNLSIRESATLLMNNFNNQRASNKNVQPPAIVTSNTVTTNEEQKRLEKYEKQQELEPEKASNNNLQPTVNIISNTVMPNKEQDQLQENEKQHDLESEKSKRNEDKEEIHAPTVLQQNEPKTYLSRKKNSTNDKSNTNSNDLNSFEQKDSNPINIEETTPNIDLPFTSSPDKYKTTEKPKSIISSPSGSGRNTPKSQTDSEDNERVIMSFSTRRKLRKRMESSSSFASNDTITSQYEKNSTNKESSNRMTPTRLGKVVEIVMNVLGKTKEDISVISTKSENSTKDNSKSQKSDSVKEEDFKPVEEVSIKNEKGNIIKKSQKTSDYKCGKNRISARELENLGCTLKKYSIPPFDLKRRLSSASSNQNRLNSSMESIYEMPKKKLRINGSTDCDNNSSSDGEIQARITRRKKACIALQVTPNVTIKSMRNLKVRLRRLPQSLFENKNDSESSDDEKTLLQHTYKNVQKDPFDPFMKVTLTKLTSSEIMKWTSLKVDDSQSEKDDETCTTKPKITPTNGKSIQNINITKQKLEETPILVPITSKIINTPKKASPKLPMRLNTDKNMTLNSTKTCVLCNKRPLDLTNHYVAQHQTESYTSRLTSDVIENLESNINLAVPHRNRYKVKCRLCIGEDDELEDNFINFHAHFSWHTGEYGYKCDVCEMVKPFREDIRCHQQRAGICRNGKIRSNYVYASDLVVIYLYVCNLCNFVQLNEANIYKHQRDHHGIRFEEPKNVKKVIIAAKDNGEVLNEVMPHEEEDLNVSIEKNRLSLEQEFVSEYPLDIKDVMLTQEQDHSKISETSLLENTNREMNSDLKTISNLEPVSPSKPAFKIMTVIHTVSNENQQKIIQTQVVQENDKPKTKEISIAGYKGTIPRSIYRQIPLGTNYFGLYKCTFKPCWFSTNDPQKFFQHTISVHTSNDRKVLFGCAYCQFKSTRVQYILAHVHAKHSMSRFQCAECAYRSAIPGNVVSHRTIYHADSNLEKCIYECTSRLKALDEKWRDLLQKMVDNISPIKCPDCKEHFFAILNMKTHYQKEHSAKNVAILNKMGFAKFACLHCKEESGTKENMRIHLALNHPDEIAYVAERKLKSRFLADAAKNLNLVNLSLPVTSADIYKAVVEECDSLGKAIATKEDLDTDSQKSFDDGPPAKQIKLMQTNVPEIKIDEDVSLILPKCETPMTAIEVPTITEEEKQLRPLLELLTENTGAPSSTLYRCPQCIASFLHFNLWKKHVLTRHQITDTVSCFYCPKVMQINSAELHFEIHRRHEYICFHCITSFCSRAKICEHFVSYHSKIKTTITRKVTYVDATFYIFKEKEVSLDWLQMFNKLSDALRHQLRVKLQLNRHKEWWAGLSTICLEELEIPQYVKNGLPRYKCLLTTCPFVGADEKDLEVHLTQKSYMLQNYNCTYCGLEQNNFPSWEQVKNHTMLHKEELHICCVCKFFHHNISGIIKHIAEFHNIRDVPVISMWRNDETNFKTSITFFLPENRMSFATTEICFCCQKVIKNSAKLVSHLQKEHSITLCPKCEICDAIVLTHYDAVAHAREHQMETFQLKYELLTSFLYNLIVTSTVPFCIESRLIKEKRISEDFEASLAKMPKPVEEINDNIKQEVVIKTECDEVAMETPSALVKCVKLKNLIQNDGNAMQPQPPIISLRPLSALRLENPQHIEYSRETGAPCNIPNPSVIPNHTIISNNPNVILNNPNNNELMIPNNRLANYILTPQESTFISQGIQINANMQPNFGTQNLLVPSNAHPPQNISNQPSKQIENQLQLNMGVQNSQQLFLNAQLPQNTINQPFDPILPELIPICGNCSTECTDFSQLRLHFEGMHAHKSDRFLFRIARKVECAYCSFRCSVTFMLFHHKNYHPDKILLCRSVVDSRRCGVCNEFFRSINLPNQPVCGCPRSKRTLADCLDVHILTLLQEVGEPYFKYACDICNSSFTFEQQCRQHIAQAHRTKSDPIITCAKMVCTCFACEKTNTSIKEIITHIKNVHLPGTAVESFNDRMSVYNNIRITFPKGLTVCVGDLKNTQFCNESFRQTVLNCENNTV